MSVQRAERAGEVLGPGRTRATYRLETDLGFYVPGPLMQKGTELLMGGVVKGLQARVGRESR